LKTLPDNLPLPYLPKIFRPFFHLLADTGKPSVRLTAFYIKRSNIAKTAARLKLNQKCQYRVMAPSENPTPRGSRASDLAMFAMHNANPE
jgi:hypothetical protein